MASRADKLGTGSYNAEMAGPLVRIYGAITFYLENKEKVEDYLKVQEQRWDALRRERPKSDDLLSNRLREAKEQASLRRS